MILEDEGEDEEDDDEDGESCTKAGHTVKPTNSGVRNGEGPKCVTTFRDVENTMKLFSGDVFTIKVQRWVREFEKIAELYGWTDVPLH